MMVALTTKRNRGSSDVVPYLAPSTELCPVPGDAIKNAELPNELDSVPDASARCRGPVLLCLWARHHGSYSALAQF